MEWSKGVIGLYGQISGGAAVISKYGNRNNAADNIRVRNIFFSDKTKKNVKREIKLNTNQLYDIFLLIWLDGIHDKYIESTFSQWLELQINDSSSVFNNSKDLLGSFLRLANKGFIGPYFKSMFDIKLPTINNISTAKWSNVITKIKSNLNGTSFKKFPSGWERQFKVALITKNKCSIYEGGELVGTKNFVNVGIDQEFSSNEERAITNLINTSNKVDNFLTLGNILDPGRTMLPKGVSRELSGMAKKTEPGSKYFIGPMDFKINDEKNNNVIHIEIKIDENDKISVLLNDKTLRLPQSAGGAKKTIDQTEQISKYMGDALQYLILTVQDPVYTHENGAVDYSYFASGDSMALVGYDFYKTLLKNKQTLFIADFSKFFTDRFAISFVPPGVEVRSRKLNTVPALTEFVNKPATNDELINTNSSKPTSASPMKYSPIKGRSQASTPVSMVTSPIESVGGFSPVTATVYNSKSPVSKLARMSPKQLKTVEDELRERLKALEEQAKQQAATIKKQEQIIRNQRAPAPLPPVNFMNQPLLAMENAMKTPPTNNGSRPAKRSRVNNQKFSPPRFINMTNRAPGIGNSVMSSPK